MTRITAAILTATSALAFAVPAQAQFFGPGVDNNTVLGGLAGAGIGGAIGSNIAGSGNRDEGTAIGALVGGLAGAAYGNSRSNYYANPYAGQFNPGFNGRTLLGTAAGAGIGGAIGSNLAGSGVREEGTAIGALIGGVAGYALSDNRGAFSGRGYRTGYNAPAYGSGYGYQYGYAPQPVLAQPRYVQPSYGYSYGYAAPTQTFGGYVSGPTYASTQTYTVQAPRTISYVQPRYTAVPTTTSYYYSNCSRVC